MLAAGQATDFFTFDATAGQTLVVTPGKPQDIGGSLAQTLAAAAYLVADGAAEDGYEAIEVALQHGGFRPGAAVNVILVTDEGRSLIDPEATPQSTLTSLQAHNALLNSVIRTRMKDENHQLALGADARGNAYLADGQGNYLISSGATNIPGAYFAGDGRNESSDIDYVDFTWQTVVRPPGT